MSLPLKSDLTYYDILKVDRRATIAEIVAAYHQAKNAFSKDSVATYSLFSVEETQSILDRLEEAYLTLSNIEKKREYDEKLDSQGNSAEANVIPFVTRETEAQLAETPSAPSAQAPGFDEAAPRPAIPESVLAANSAASAPVTERITGTILRDIREKRTLTIDDVARITKIPTKFIRAIESDEKTGLPARVYLQGFVKNLATLYRIDPGNAVKSDLEFLDSRDAQG